MYESFCLLSVLLLRRHREVKQLSQNIDKGRTGTNFLILQSQEENTEHFTFSSEDAQASWAGLARPTQGHGTQRKEQLCTTTCDKGMRLLWEQTLEGETCHPIPTGLQHTCQRVLCVRVHTCVRACACVCVHACAYACVHVHTCVCMAKCVSVCVAT